MLILRQYLGTRTKTTTITFLKSLGTFLKSMWILIPLLYPPLFLQKFMLLYQANLTLLQQRSTLALTQQLALALSLRLSFSTSVAQNLSQVYLAKPDFAPLKLFSFWKGVPTLASANLPRISRSQRIAKLTLWMILIGFVFSQSVVASDSILMFKSKYD